MCCAYHQCATKTERNELGNAQGRPFKPVFQCLPSFNVFGRVDPAPSKCFGAANGAFPIPTAKNRRLRVRIYIVVRLSPSTCIHRTVFVVTSIHLSHPLGLGPGNSFSNRQGDASLCTRTRNTKKKNSPPFYLNIDWLFVRKNNEPAARLGARRPVSLAIGRATVETTAPRMKQVHRRDSQDVFT